MSLSFAELGVPSDLVAALARRGITEPFPIQAASLPDALAGRDICGKAPTGSGKTLAFGIAAVARLGPSPAPARRPSVLVLTPTRELCAQVGSELAALAGVRGAKVATLYGGVGYDRQIKALRRGVDIAVACPGRLGDLIAGGHVRLDAVATVVVDEADRMSDMGFLPDVRRLLDQTPDTRQTVLFSATLDGAVDVLVRRYQTDPARHELVVTEEENANSEHHFWRIEPADRADMAVRITAVGPTIVFCRTRHAADRTARQLTARGVRAVAIHGDRSQSQRERALSSFASGQAGALVATDVAARGIHVDGVAAVVHFDPPADAKDYVHRSGRTARAGATGIVVSLVTPDKVKAVRTIQRHLG
ncbi:MAG: DEAD/DEAH box helicase, partial [Acidimicrobiales bacterium]